MSVGLSTEGDSESLKRRFVERVHSQYRHLAGVTDLPKSETRVNGEDLICPITLELPFDPVTAGDGFVYERCAIQQHIRSDPIRLRSPMTNLPMGPNLVPNVQVKHTIQNAIGNGEIKGNLSEEWRLKEASNYLSACYEKLALAGDGNAAMMLALFCDSPVSDQTTAFTLSQNACKWWKISAEAGVLRGLTFYGSYLATTRPTENERSQGIAYLMDAAMQGYKRACLLLGKMYAEGITVSRNDVEAERWLKKGLQQSDGTVPEVFLREMNDLLTSFTRPLLQEPSLSVSGQHT
ncbi:MAG: hypothetical protein SGILL_002073 [Bacillariaceae sp.]